MMAEVGGHDGPVARYRRREGHPQGNGGKGGDQVHAAHHHPIHHSAEEPGQPAQQDPEQGAEHHPHQADGQGDTRGVHGAGEQVAAQAVGTEQEQRRPRAGGEQVQPRREQPPQQVLETRGQEAHRVERRGVAHVHVAEGFGIALPAQLGDERAARTRRGQLAGGEPADGVGRAAHVVREPLQRGVGRHHVGQQGAQVEHREHRRRHRGQPVASELEPHEPPLRGDVVTFLLRGGLVHPKSDHSSRPPN